MCFGSCVEGTILYGAKGMDGPGTEAPGHVTFTIRIQGKMKAGA